MALSKDLPYNKILKHYVVEFMEKGQIPGRLLKWKIKQPTCPIEDFHDLSIKKLVFLFCIIVGGILLSIMVMMYEMLTKRRTSLTITETAKNCIRWQLQSELQQMKEAIEYKVEDYENPETLIEDLLKLKKKVLK